MEFSGEENASDVASLDDIMGPEDLFDDEADVNDEADNDDEEAKEKSEKLEKDSKEKGEKKVKQPRIVKNPRVTLNFDTLSGKNGLSALKKMFKNFKFKGKNHEEEDLAKILGILQHWMCYQLCPSYDFESCILQLEALGKKKVVQTLMKKYRLGMNDWGENRSDNVDNATADTSLDTGENTSRNEFDLLLHEDIVSDAGDKELSETFQTQKEIQKSVGTDVEITLTPEQLERIIKNRELAKERRLKRMAAQNETAQNQQPTEGMDSNEMSDKMNVEEIS